ncbi:hypothetical protein OSB04_006086 [Centaurea solstitialis]|uniref:25S rRNA (uridine-N(3))-methyltransferase BMT5-like domain-containing protein n=1 Tax=Centaurea solstitialis TaxID=347529 RepID=A0AA38TV29_9ASTR|nr:hypothetical protein OSB04_006086 [Centaurea solstitialis]
MAMAANSSIPMIVSFELQPPVKKVGGSRMLAFKRTKAGFRSKVVVSSYSNNKRILLVGEADFSFSLSLATSFESAENMVPTTIDSYDDAIVKHNKAQGNIELLKQLGAQVFHGVDATKMAANLSLPRRMYDRIIFNFPHAGYCGEYEAHPDMIMSHQRLVRGFLDNAIKMLHPYTGEIHLRHRTQYPFNKWEIIKIAYQCGLVLIDSRDFNIGDYPGYQNKRGAGSKPDKPFPLESSKTFKFFPLGNSL